MLFIPANRDDIIKYFRHTYLKFKETGDTLYYINDVDMNKVSGTVDSGQPFNLYLDNDHPYEVDYVLPHKSFFQVEKHAVMLQRVPAKQYSRGLSEANTALYYMNGKEKGNMPLSFEILKLFVKKQQFQTLAQATQDAEKMSCVLTPRMMYNRADRNIYMDFFPVAKVNWKEQAIHMLQPIFEEEVNDFLRSSSESNIFTVNK